MHTQHAYGTVFFQMHENAADRVRKVGVHARMQGVDFWAPQPKRINTLSRNIDTDDRNPQTSRWWRCQE